MYRWLKSQASACKADKQDGRIPPILHIYGRLVQWQNRSLQNSWWRFDSFSGRQNLEQTAWLRSKGVRSKDLWFAPQLNSCVRDNPASPTAKDSWASKYYFCLFNSVGQSAILIRWKSLVQIQEEAPNTYGDIAQMDRRGFHKAHRKDRYLLSPPSYSLIGVLHTSNGVIRGRAVCKLPESFLPRPMMLALSLRNLVAEVKFLPGVPEFDAAWMDTQQLARLVDAKPWATRGYHNPIAGIKPCRQIYFSPCQLSGITTVS